MADNLAIRKHQSGLIVGVHADNGSVAFPGRAGLVKQQIDKQAVSTSAKPNGCTQSLCATTNTSKSRG
ncbi:MAG: hypothetical protein ACE5JL_05270, partial [Dehalococcoidia bacterium]